MSFGIDIPTNAAPVSQATPDLSDAEILKVRERASAEVVVASSRAAGAEVTSKNTGSDAFGVLADAAVDAFLPGLRPYLAVGQLAVERSEDFSSSGDGAAATSPSFLSKGLGLFEKASLAEASLREPSPAGLHQPDARGSKESGNWEVKQKLASTQLAKELGLGGQVHKRALDSTYAAERNRHAVIGVVAGMAPGMNRNFAPRRTSDLLSDARKQSDESRA
jgi:hypothetical protein